MIHSVSIVDGSRVIHLPLQTLEISILSSSLSDKLLPSFAGRICVDHRVLAKFTHITL